MVGEENVPGERFSSRKLLNVLRVSTVSYAAARRKNILLGSGNVEATCKALVELRMKRAGSRWKILAAEEVIQCISFELSIPLRVMRVLLGLEFCLSI